MSNENAGILMSVYKPAVSTDDAKIADMWSISGKLLHTDAYRRTFAKLLAQALGDRDQSILDAACGTGFPMIELRDLGFKNLTGADADRDLLDEFRATIAARQDRDKWNPELKLARWQELPQRIDRQFDTVLNVDAAIGFMDSWLPGDMRQGPVAIFARVIEVLRNFHAVTRPGGRFFIGLQKNNHKGNSYHPMFVGRMLVDGREALAHWNMSYDWQTRIKTWVNQVEWDGQRFEQMRQSYLFDLDELAGFLREAGFAAVTRLPTPDDLYEDILIATRAG
ncbi:class I SAM-dependent methyltransferase [Dongia sp.]|uniref:class I SAM-dependent methyltransferase n=1 Tax=Dongia sp. TaxID=1977262 RepID=UPI0035B259F3